MSPRNPHRIRPQLLPLLLLLALAGLSAAPAGAASDEAAALAALISHGEPEAALARADRAIAAEPHNAQLRFQRAVALMDLGRDRDAMQAFTALTEEFPELPDPYNNIALLEVRAGHYELALQALRTALRNDPQHVVARANLAEVYLLLAEQALREASVQSPADHGLQRRLEAVRALVATPTAPGATPAR